MGLLITDRIPNYDNFGTNSLVAFRQACIQSIKEDYANAAFYRLLADHAEHLIDAYHQVPLHTAVADRDFEHFQMLVKTALNAVDQPTDRRLELINEMAAAKFF